MADFVSQMNDPAFRAIVQDGILEREFQDALFAGMLFRTEVVAKKWPENMGTRQIFSVQGLMEPDLTPIPNGEDPTVGDFGYEQYEAELAQYGKAVDINMLNSAIALANLFLSRTKALGLQAAQSLNRGPRNRMFNAAESGWTVAGGAQSPTGTTVTLRVKRLNGFTKARYEDGSSTNTVRFERVGPSNPLAVQVYSSGAYVDRHVVGFTPDTSGDECGPGTLSLINPAGGAADLVCLDRAVVRSVDRTYIVRSGGGDKVDDIGSSDLPTFSNLRDLVAHMRSMNVPTHKDGQFHVHLDPTSESKLFLDADMGRLNTSLPDYYMYRDLAIGQMHGCLFYRNNEVPQLHTVRGGVNYTVADPFAPELTNNGAANGVPIHRMLVSGAGSILEHYLDLGVLASEAGVNGKVVVGNASVSNNGVEVQAERVRMVFSAPKDRFQQKIGVAWQFLGDWPMRTDVLTGDASRYKRVGCILHGE